MSESSGSTAVWLGERVRRARLERGLTQRSLAHRSGVSQTMICRMELGRGGAVPLDTWAAVASAAGIPLAADALIGEARISSTTQRRCHALIVDAATFGQWTAATEFGPRHIRTVLVRVNRREAAVVVAWDLVTEVGTALAELEASLDAERRRRGENWLVSGLVVAPKTTANRRRITEAQALLERALPAGGVSWVLALRDMRIAMPSTAGLIWTDKWATQIRPTPRRPGWVWGV